MQRSRIIFRPNLFNQPLLQWNKQNALPHQRFTSKERGSKYFCSLADALFVSGADFTASSLPVNLLRYTLFALAESFFLSRLMGESPLKWTRNSLPHPSVDSPVSDKLQWQKLK